MPFFKITQGARGLEVGAIDDGARLPSAEEAAKAYREEKARIRDEANGVVVRAAQALDITPHVEVPAPDMPRQLANQLANPVSELASSEPLTCSDCAFRASTPAGLAAHRRARH